MDPPFEIVERIAILADIHGNSIALNAVLDDIESRGGADEYWLLGDYVAIGPDPLGVLQRLEQLQNTRSVRGNTDRYLVDGSLPWPKQADVDRNPELYPLYLEVVRSFAWSSGAVGASGWLPWLAALPLEFQVTLPDGTRVLAVHASPGQDDEPGIHRYLSADALAERTLGAECDLLLVGHTHAPFDLTLGYLRILNPGSVSNPLPPDLRAAYALLCIEDNGYVVQHHRVDYDRDKLIASTRAVNHPGSEFIAKLMRGQVQPSWMISEEVSGKKLDDR
jgi:predicted phosphodiesterase